MSIWQWNDRKIIIIIIISVSPTLSNIFEEN